jgi:energy-coupling factor transporter ATP-binding protein EcfA2
MEAGIDCVAITDHNHGGWIDTLKAAYSEMKASAQEGNPPAGFRELTLFPGVEISVNGGFHLLAIYDPSAQTSDIDSLLAVVRYTGTKGDSDGVTTASGTEVVQAVLNAGAIPIPAHADQDDGLLQVKGGTSAIQLDANTVRQIIDDNQLLAVEWVDVANQAPEVVKSQANALAKILGSDCHSFQGNAVPGSRYTWVKMDSPTLEGLRLALLDGNDTSIRRSDAGDFDPNQTPAHFVTQLEIKSARLMGNGGAAEVMQFSPYYNALIGGRGSGKSTIVHALRLAYRRDNELRHLDDASDPVRQFDSFTQSYKKRQGAGGLRDDTEIHVHVHRDGLMHRLRWRFDGEGVVVEDRQPDSSWRESDSQVVSPERFPVRIFSQGQIAAMAGESRQALFDVIDEAAAVGELRRTFDEAVRTYLTQQARLRELDGRLQGRTELRRKLSDLNRKLKAFEQSHHADVLKLHQRAVRQRREVENTIDQLRSAPNKITTSAHELLLDDWPDTLFDTDLDRDAIEWKARAERNMEEFRQIVTAVAQEFTKKIESLKSDEQLAQWEQRADRAQAEYQSLHSALSEQGVTDPQAFGALVQERQQLEAQVKHLKQIQEDRDSLAMESGMQWQKVLQARKAITNARKAFLDATLTSNPFVRIEVAGFGYDPLSVENSLRKLLDCDKGRFEADILGFTDGKPSSGLAFELASSNDTDATLNSVKDRLITPHEGLNGRFRNFLQKRLERPEFVDEVRCWFPDDDLHIQYSRKGDGNDWARIDQGSQGQRSAALLAFLLAFGNEPLILDQPEDDLDNHLIYELIVRQIRENKQRRQLIIVTHNPNVLVNGDAEMVHVLDYRGGQCRVWKRGALQQGDVREEVCRVMEGGREALTRRWARLGREV